MTIDLRTVGVQTGPSRGNDKVARGGLNGVSFLTLHLARPNEPLTTVAEQFSVSASRVSKIQAAIKLTPLIPRQQLAMEECKVKLTPPFPSSTDHDWQPADQSRAKAWVRNPAGAI